MGSLFRGMVVTAAALLLVAAVPAQAAPQWSEPKALSQPPVGAGGLAMDAMGNTLVVFGRRSGDGSNTWEGQRFESSYRWWMPGRGWGPMHDIPRERGYIAATAITPRGEATLLVKGSGAERVPLALATATAGGRIDDFEPIGEAYGSGGSHALGIDDAGNATVAWARADAPGRIVISSRPAGGSVGAPQEIEGQQSGRLAVTVNPAGAAAVSWMEGDGRPRVSYRPPGGTFGPREDPGLGRMSFAHAALDLDGRLLVAASEDGPMQWPGQPGSKPPRAALAVRSPLGGWSEPQIVDEAGQTTGMSVDSRGVATLFVSQGNAWNRDGKSFIVTRQPDGRLEREQLWTDSALNPAAAMNHRGDLLAIWGSRPGDEPAVLVRERPFGEPAFGATRTIANSQPSSGVGAVLNDAGQAMAIWHEVVPDGQGYKAGPVRVVIRDDPSLHPPAPPDVDLYRDPLAALDGDGDLRAPVSCAVSCKVRATGIVFPGGDRKALAGSGGRSVRLKARRRSRVKLDFGEQGAQAVRDALAAGERPWVSVTVSARGKSPRPLIVSRRYKLRG